MFDGKEYCGHVYHVSWQWACLSCFMVRSTVGMFHGKEYCGMFVMFHFKEYCGHVWHVSWKGVLWACL